MKDDINQLVPDDINQQVPDDIKHLMTHEKKHQVSLRKFPYPYRNMLSILSDTDRSSKKEFEEMHRFMNTTGDCGSLGLGVGLDIGDTFFMGTVGAQDNHCSPDAFDSDHWRYWWNDTKREIYAGDIRRYIRAGWIDIPHTFFAYTDKSRFSREEAEAVISEWEKIGFKPIAWIDHERNPWNIMQFRRGYLVNSAGQKDNLLDISVAISEINAGDYLIFPDTGEKVTVERIEKSKPLKICIGDKLKNNYNKFQAFTLHSAEYPNEGAVSGSQFYCVDLALKAGIKVFWTRLPKEIRVQTDNGRRGFPTTLIPQTLPDGCRVWGLMRYYEQGQTNNTYLGACINRVLYGDDLSGGKPMSPETYMIISTHLGYADIDGRMDKMYEAGDDVYQYNGHRWFNKETVAAFRKIKEEQDNGRVLVARTSRLIKYNLAHDLLGRFSNSRKGYTVNCSGGFEQIIIHELHDDLFGAFSPTLEDLRGITFYCNNPERAEIWLGKDRISRAELQVNEKDHTGQKSIGIKWHNPDTNDYCGFRSPRFQ